MVPSPSVPGTWTSADYSTPCLLQYRGHGPEAEADRPAAAPKAFAKAAAARLRHRPVIN